MPTRTLAPGAGTIYAETPADLTHFLEAAPQDAGSGHASGTLPHTTLQVVDEIGHRPLTPNGANLLFPLVAARYGRPRPCLPTCGRPHHPTVRSREPTIHTPVDDGSQNRHLPT